MTRTPTMTMKRSRTFQAVEGITSHKRERQAGLRREQEGNDVMKLLQRKRAGSRCSGGSTRVKMRG